MAQNEYLQGGIDAGTQVKFPYTYISTPGYANGDTLNEVYDNFGIIVTQGVNNVTVSMPTSGLGTDTRNYFRQITSRHGSSYNLTIDLDGSNTTTLRPGDTCMLFWTGSQWMSSPAVRYESIQGRIEAPEEGAYLIVNGDRNKSYLSKIQLNVTSGTGAVSLLRDGLTATSANLSLVAGTDSQYTFSPKLEIEGATTIAFQFSNLANLKGVHYRIDLDSAP